MNKFVAYVLAILTILSLVVFIITRQDEPFTLSSFRVYQNLITTGIGNTIIVSIVSLLGSLVLGFIFYLFSISKVKYLNALTDVFTEIIYGTPLLVFIVITAFVIGPAFGTYNRNAMGYLALIIYMTPYMKNVYQSAFSSIGRDQYMTMDLFGFTPYQRYRYIIIPQVIRILMPPMMNNFTMIIKGSALLNVISYTELYYAIRVAQSQTFAFVEGYILMWVLYLMITIPLSQATKYIERKWAL
ncbi:amino acid ABC transporter permease [Peloplasma aerotolerans]|uniref:ABC transporter permease subunit n=1 Tax=Peloplasma aerotolerans TaxID=3044389 RepID=A0AAW6U875_9MOLU|nr:ABC transporter permease subunit [Mariniplasma sp. M4Ah]MDI6452975.1 ABC transporter permease subunit [Mariniplasma sp. M4Ah]